MKTVLRVTGFVKGHWHWLAFAFVCLALSTAFSLIVPRMLGRGIDTALRVTESGFLWWPMPREQAIWWIAGAVVIASVLRGASEYGQTYLSQTVSQKTSYDVRNWIYERLQRLSFAYHDQAQTGQLMSRATVDVEAIRMFFAMGILGILQLSIMLIAISVILIMLNWKLALLTLAFMPLIAWRTITFSNHLRPIWLKIQELMAALGIILEESLTGIRIVKAFSRQKEEGKKFSDQATLLYDEQIGVAQQMAFNVPLMLLFMSLPTALILWYGGSQVVTGAMTIGEITEFLLYVGMLVMPVRRMGMMGNVLSRTMSAGERILEILDTESAVKEKPGAVDVGKVEGSVTFEGVSFSYDSLAPTLDNISFNVQPGNLVALLGGSGSGKSTIANLLPRFYDVTAGRIAIDGVDIRDMTIASLRRNIGIAQQDIFLFSGTIKDNVSYGSVSANTEQIETVSKAAHLHEFVTTLPDGYDTWVGERGLTLSGGEKQRLAIARTLLIDPGILILDDSMSSVDAETERLIREALRILIKGRTTFIITHRIPIIKNADLILMLRDGKLIESGKHDELIAKEGLYYQTYQTQLIADDNNDG